MSSLDKLRNLVLEALTCIVNGYMAPPTKTPFQNWCTKVQELFNDIEDEKERLRKIGISVPTMPQCTHLIELGLCVATKEFGFSKLKRSFDQVEQIHDLRELMWSELGKGSDGPSSHKRARDRDESSGSEKRKKMNHSDSEDDSSSSTAEDEAITKALVHRKDNPCDRCRKLDVAGSCYMRPMKNGGIAMSCFRCYSTRQRCVTNTYHVRWQLISGRYIGTSDYTARSGGQRQRFYYEKAPIAPLGSSRKATRRSSPRRHIQTSVAEIITQNDRPQQPSTSQLRITVETSSVPSAQPDSNASTLRPRSEYPLTPPLENPPSNLQQPHFSLSPTPSAFIASNSKTGHPQDTRALNAIAHRLHGLQASFTRVEDKVHLLVNKGSFALDTTPDGIDMHLLELDIGETLGDKLAQLERGSQKFETAFLKALSRSRQTTPTSNQSISTRSSPSATGPMDLLKIMKDILGKLQRKSELASTYLQFARLVDRDNHGRSVKLCQDTQEDVKELSRHLRKLCVELKESLALAERDE